MNSADLPRTGLWIYFIIGPTGKVYVGKSKRPHSRCGQYIHAVKNRNRKHVNDHLLNAMLKHGVSEFNMVAVEQCSDPAHLAERELFWIDTLGTTDRSRGYNLRRDSSTGMITHPETSARITKNLKSQWARGLRQDHAAKLSKSWDNRDRAAQGRLFSRVKTKWRYKLHIDDTCVDVTYHGLRALKLWSGAVSFFSRHKTDRAHVKGFIIEREAVNRA